MTAISRTDVDVSSTQTLTGKTLTSPKVNQISDTGGAAAIVVSAVASAANQLTVTGTASGGGAATLAASGSDTNVSLRIASKGSSPVSVRPGGYTAATIYAAATTVNYFQINAAVAGSAPSISVVGSDTNVGLNLIPKGSGVVQAGGDPVGVKVAVPANGTATGKPGQWAADANYIYAYTGDGSTHSWVRSATTAW